MAPERSPCASSPRPPTPATPAPSAADACSSGSTRRATPRPRLERHVLRHRLRRQRALHPAGRGRRPRRGHRPDHPHRHTSMHILVTVSAGNPRTATCGRRPSASWSSSRSTSDGRPTPVPLLEPRTSEDREWQESAVTRIDLRAEIASRDGGADLQRRGHGAARRAALPRRAHRRQLGRQGARRHRHALDRRGRPRARHAVDRRPRPTSPSMPVASASTGRCGSATSSRSRRGCCSPARRACTSASTSGPGTRPPASST